MASTSNGRSASCLQKLERMNKALHHQEPDRVPISDFFWGGFVRRWRQELGLPGDADPYVHYDLDWIVTVPNMDPRIKQFEIIKEDDEEVLVHTGFLTTIRKLFSFPMPEQISWDTDTIEKLEAMEFDDPADPRRFYSGGDNQIAGVGDGFVRDLPPWIDTVKEKRRDFPVYGSMIEASECVTRLLGQMNTLMWIGEYPERFGEQILRIGEFYFQCAKAAIDAAEGLLDGFVIWGDVAYRDSMFFAPDYWRTYYKPTVARMIDLCHQHGLPVIYHGCGAVQPILRDYIEIGLDAYNPLEAKAGLDVVELRRELGHRLAFCGNGNIPLWESGDKEAIRREVLHKLNAAKGGGLIFQSDHSVSSSVAGTTYDYIVKLVRQYGQYPINLGEFDEPV
jgi:uroporphyrinogen decarboxylase